MRSSPSVRPTRNERIRPPPAGRRTLEGDPGEDEPVEREQQVEEGQEGHELDGVGRARGEPQAEHDQRKVDRDADVEAQRRTLVPPRERLPAVANSARTAAVKEGGFSRGR